MSDTEEAPLGIMKKADRKKSVSRAEKAGIVFPVSRFNRHLRDSRKSKRVGAGAPVYLAAILEYAANEILEMSEKQLGKKKKRISPMEIMRAIRSDQELNALLGGGAFFAGDRVKNVSAALKYTPPPPKPVAEAEAA